THPQLTRVSDTEAQEEMHSSKAYLEEITDQTITSFCYPQGYYTSAHVAMAKKEGFTLARTVKRFAFAVGPNPFVMPTTLHTYRHWSDALPILQAVGWKKFLSCYLDWEVLARELFDQTVERGGVFHLWGHSWETDMRGDWERLERVLQHISNRKGIEYVTNQKLIIS
ncbi:MAG: polysaccharide deacetylase family protein, partial [Patescibacteria group bacterium]|nr:polysaccharide deacetylase family protein [Patescibacteria group bacterium]